MKRLPELRCLPFKYWYNMEVKSSNAGLLTNSEVLTLCQEQRMSRSERGNKINNLSTVLYETCKYLQGTPCTSQTPQIIHEFASSVVDFKLTKAELLQLVNLRPTTPVEIQLIVEECEERLTEEQVDELIGLIEKHLPRPAPPTPPSGKPGRAKKSPAGGGMSD